MARSNSSKKYTPPRMPKGNDEAGRFVDRNLMKVNPRKQQFEPTPAEPVRLRYKMAGGC